MKETLKEYKARYYQENKERLRKQQKEYTLKHKEDKKAYDKEYNKKNKDKKAKWAKEYWIKNKEIIKNKKDNKKWQESCYKAKQRCENTNNKAYKDYGGRGIKFLMTSSDFEFLWFRDKAYEMDKPTIDRIDNDGNYELSNCRFIEHIENIVKNKRKSVDQYDLNGNFIKNWKSMSEAARVLNISQSSISECTRGNRNKTGGFIWKLAEIVL